MSRSYSPRVLCVACSSQVFTKLDQTLGRSGLHILSAATRDRGVAICVAEAVSLAVLDADSIRGEQCSLATALKMVRPGLPIILIEERKRLSPIPDNIDAVVQLGATETLVAKIVELLDSGKQESRAADPGAA